MSEAWIILGDQLFEPKVALKRYKGSKVFMAEDWALCTDTRHHKHKLILFLSAMRHYRDQLIEAGIDLSYYDASHKSFKKSYFEKIDEFIQHHPDIKRFHIYEIEEKSFESQLHQWFSDRDLGFEVHPSPLFLISRASYQDYLKSSKKPFMKTFYERFRGELDILMQEDGPEGGKWSFDQENRKKLPKNLIPPPLPATNPDGLTQEVMALVDTLFEDHPGDSQYFWLPVTHQESQKWLTSFCQERLCFYGDYQDAISS